MIKASAVTTHFSDSDLDKGLKGYRIIKDPAYKDLSIEDLLQDSNDVCLVSRNLRRAVYFIQTPFGNFFLKFSPMRHKKDRRRFLLLPWRITTEWRNLDKLKKKAVQAPQRVLFGYKGRLPCRGFFLVTAEAGGSELDCRNPAHMSTMADYLAGLHAKGVYHRDLHPGNMLIRLDGDPVLLDAQEIYFLPWLPHWFRRRHLGRLWRYIRFFTPATVSLEAFLEIYNSRQKRPVQAREVHAIAERRQQTYYKSRSKRCCKNSTEFQVVKNGRGGKGFKQRKLQWGRDELYAALKHGTYLKDSKLIAYNGVCVKIHNKGWLHKNRCLISWKMARALAVRGVNVPEALAYLALNKTRYFVMRYYHDSMILNTYLCSLSGQAEKRAVVQRLAEWVRSCHDLNIWQRDFKSSNVLVLGDRFMMVDLEGVKIKRRLSWGKRLINLAQLHASVSDQLTVKDRLRFFYVYCRGHMPTKENRRKMYQKIWQITQDKNTGPFGLDLTQLARQLSIYRKNSAK